MRRFFVVPGFLLAVSAPVSAQTLPPREVVPPSSTAAAAAEDPTKLVFDLGYVKTGGNTDVQTITGREKLEHTSGQWRFLQEVGAVNGQTDGIETAARYDARLRADYSLSDRVGVYGLADWRRDPFAGISSQFQEGIGAVLHAVRPIPHELDFEGGLGMLQRRFTSEAEDNFATARLGMHYAYHFAEKANFGADVSYLMNLEDTGDGDLHGLFRLVAPLAGGISLRAGYDLYYRTEPQAGFEKLDTTFSTGLQISI